MTILEVLLNDDGSVTYRVRPTQLSTVHYGIMLANVARDIGAMMQGESSGEIVGKAAVAQIAAHFCLTVDEMSEPSEPARMLQ